MRPEDIRELRDAQPFVPFRICLTDFVMVARTVIDIGIASNPTSGVYDQIIRVSPLHIVRVENLKAA